MSNEGVTVMLDLRLDPSDELRVRLEDALRNRPGIRFMDFSPHVRRIMRVNYDSDAIKAAEIGRVVHAALGAQGPNTRIVGL
jgi:hypothetical protein